MDALADASVIVTNAGGVHVPAIWSRLTKLVAHNLSVLAGETAGPPRNMVETPNRG